MTLDKNELEIFFDLYFNLLFFTNRKKNIIKNVNSLTDTKLLEKNDCFKIKNVTFSDAQIILDFIEENRNNYSKDKIEILENWSKYFVRNKFFIVKHTKSFTVFMDSNDRKKIYSVVGLTSSLEEMFPKSYLPALINTILLPFKNKIVYDGFITYDNVRFGSNMAFDIAEDFKINNAKYGLIKDLTIEKDFSNENIEELLSEYLKKPDFYEEEICSIINENDKNYVTYSRLVSKNYLKKYRKKIKELALKDKYYVALYFDAILQTGYSESELNERINNIIPKDKLEYIYIKKI
ncbi:MAG TPA: hypothetical protein PLO89_10620 [Spirochaetota bacterium]|nr:hypothetical protein [Spirochaetota bacterium]